MLYADSIDRSCSFSLLRFITNWDLSEVTG